MVRLSRKNETYRGREIKVKCHPFKKLGGSHGVDFVPIPKNASRQERLKKVVEGLQKAGWKYESNKESKNG